MQVLHLHRLHRRRTEKDAPIKSGYACIERVQAANGCAAYDSHQDTPDVPSAGQVYNACPMEVTHGRPGRHAPTGASSSSHSGASGLALGLIKEGNQCERLHAVFPLSGICRVVRLRQDYIETFHPVSAHQIAVFVHVACGRDLQLAFVRGKPMFCCLKGSWDVHGNAVRLRIMQSRTTPTPKDDRSDYACQHTGLSYGGGSGGGWDIRPDVLITDGHL